MARIVAFKLPDELYEELERRARRLGYSLVSDYVRDLVLRELGYGGAGGAGASPEEIRKIVQEELRKLAEEKGLRVEPVDVEKLAARLERKIQDMINPWTAKIDSLSTRVAELQEKLEEIEEKLKSLEKQAAERPQHAAAYPQRPSGFHGRFEAGERREYRGGGGRRRSAVERLREQGVVFEHDVQWLRDRDAFFEKLRREGAVILNLGGERVAVDPEFWRNFKEKLHDLPTANDDEIRVLLTREQYELFRRLKESGLIYFDASEKRWKFTEEPEQA